MEEKNKRERGTRAPGKSTAEACGGEFIGTPAKKRREERTLVSEYDEEEEDRGGPSQAELRTGMSKMSAMLARLEELDKKWSSASKEGGTAENGMSIKAVCGIGERG